MPNSLVDKLSSSINGYAWILRSYRNRLGAFSVLLIFISVVAIWMVSLLTYQYKSLYFDELKGIYPSIFTKKSDRTNWSELTMKVKGIKDVRKEHFGTLVDVCIDDGKGVGFRPIRTGVRSLNIDTIKEQKTRYLSFEQKGVWISSELYEVIFGEPPSDVVTDKKISLIARPNYSNNESVNPITCETSAKKIELPIIRVLALANNARWLIVRTKDTPYLNLNRLLTEVTAVYSDYIGKDELQLYENISSYTSVKFWINELPTNLQVNLDKLETALLIFMLLTFVLAISFLLNLYLMTQKTLQESFYILRFYAVRKKQFLWRVFIGISLFWLVIFSGGFLCSYLILLLIQDSLFESFNIIFFIQNIPVLYFFYVFIFSVILPIMYIYTHFIVKNYNIKWKGTQH